MKFILYSLKYTGMGSTPPPDFQPIIQMLIADHPKNLDKDSFSFELNGLNSKKISQLATPLSQYKAIKRINLRYNDLKPEAMIQIVKLLKKNPNIQWVSLEGCAVCDGHLLQLIKSSLEEGYSIKEINIDFTRNRITDKGLIASLGKLHPMSIVSMCRYNSTNNCGHEFAYFVEGKGLEAQKAEDLDYQSLMKEFLETCPDSSSINTQFTSPETDISTDSPINNSPPLMLSQLSNLKVNSEQCFSPNSQQKNGQNKKI